MACGEGRQSVAGEASNSLGEGARNERTVGEGEHPARQRHGFDLHGIIDAAGVQARGLRTGLKRTPSNASRPGRRMGSEPFPRMTDPTMRWFVGWQERQKTAPKVRAGGPDGELFEALRGHGRHGETAGTQTGKDKSAGSRAPSQRVATAWMAKATAAITTIWKWLAISPMARSGAGSACGDNHREGPVVP